MAESRFGGSSALRMLELEEEGGGEGCDGLLGIEEHSSGEGSSECSECGIGMEWKRMGNKR